jgi:Fic family protein
VHYTPPEGEEVIREKLKNLEDYIHAQETTDPLIKSAVIHYQFEAIHPFPDGNGRTGRIVHILYLCHAGLLETPVLYLSGYINEHKSDYYHLLRTVTQHNRWEEWILYIMEAIDDTAVRTREKIASIRQLLEETIERSRAQLPGRVYSRELIELLFHQPYIKVQNLVDAGIAQRQTAAEYLKELEKTGILTMQKAGKENLYLNTGLLRVLAGGDSI